MFLKGLNTKKIDDINALQRVAWPHVLRGRNCFIVGGVAEKQGKTLSYLVPVAAKAIKDAEIMKRVIITYDSCKINVGNV